MFRKIDSRLTFCNLMLKNDLYQRQTDNHPAIICLSLICYLIKTLHSALVNAAVVHSALKQAPSSPKPTPAPIKH